jgi:hypothetical protein
MLCYDSVLQIKFSVVLLFFLGLSAILFLILFSYFGTIVQHGRQKIFFFFGCLMLVFTLKATINYYNLFCLGCQEEFRRVSYYNLGICELVYLN